MSRWVRNALCGSLLAGLATTAGAGCDKEPPVTVNGLRDRMMDTSSPEAKSQPGKHAKMRPGN